MIRTKIGAVAASGALFLGIGAAALPAGAQEHSAYAVSVAPPPPQVEAVQTRQGYVWVKGHQEWRHGHWGWTPGFWEPVRERNVWVDGHWEQRGHHWHWIDGYWQEVAVAAPPVIQQPMPVANNEFEFESEPPAEPGEVIPPPRAGYAWIGGRWWWRGRWEWQPGRWEAAREHYHWRDGHWEGHGKHHRWVEGSWEEERHEEHHEHHGHH